MDIAARKMELVDWLLHINDESKMEKIIALKSALDKEFVADTPISQNSPKNIYDFKMKFFKNKKVRYESKRVLIQGFLFAKCLLTNAKCRALLLL